MTKNFEEQLIQTEEEIIEKLLGEHEIPEETVFLKRLGVQITLKALTEKEINRARKQCTKQIKNMGRREEVLDDDQFNATLIRMATVKPNWNNPKLLGPLNLSSGEEFIKRKLLGGEMTSVVEKILDLSGYNDDIDKEEEVKN